ncbi:hypothetical protein C0J52_09041 [Blattella germanica]|nr:hypothetical protein C0J52_09041 [Blattella germanica]
MKMMMLFNFLQSILAFNSTKNNDSNILAKGPKCDLAKYEVSSLPKSCGPDYLGSGSFMNNFETAVQHLCDLVDPMRAYKEDYVFLKDEVNKIINKRMVCTGRQN